MWRPDLWLALVRSGVGALVLAVAVPRFQVGWVGPWVPYPGVVPAFLVEEGRRLSELARATPYAWHRDLLDRWVLPHATLTAVLEAWAELGVGVGLALGLLTVAAGLVGLLLAVHAGLAAHVAGTGPQPLHWLLVAAMLAFLGARAGRSWGLDAVLRRRATGAGRFLLALLT